MIGHHETYLSRAQAALDWWKDVDGGPTSSITGGGAIHILEAEASTHFDGRPCLAVASGTDALASCLIVAGVGAGDEVICSSYDWTAATDAIRRLGARPVYANPDPDTLTLEPAAARAAITSATKAILATHIFGIPADIPALVDLGLPVVEDGSQAWGATLDGHPVGALGFAAAFSLGPGKRIDAGEGGLLVLPSQIAHEVAVRSTQHPVRQLLRGIEPQPVRFSTRVHPMSAIVAAHQLVTTPPSCSAELRTQWHDDHAALESLGWKLLPSHALHRRAPVGRLFIGRHPNREEPAAPAPALWLSRAPSAPWLGTLRCPDPTSNSSGFTRGDIKYATAVNPPVIR